MKQDIIRKMINLLILMNYQQNIISQKQIIIQKRKKKNSDKIKDNLDEEKKIEVDNDYKIEEIEINTDLNKA